MHSCFSDGTDTPVEILKKCEKIGLKYISITDHDNCDAYNNAADFGNFSGKIITGIELQAYYKGISIEILGYGFNVPQMQNLLSNLYLHDVVNREELNRLYAVCKDMGMQFDDDVIEKYSASNIYYATEYLHNEIKKYDANRRFIPDDASWKRESVFFKRHISNPQSPFFIDESDLIPTAKEVIEVIHQSKGLAFLPHAFQYEENVQDILNGLAATLDGVECFYSTFTETQTNFLLEFCTKNNLYVSGGSDYHGTNRPETSLGSKTPIKYIEQWEPTVRLK
jgi:predicted metal-dependent phosphoesterase TrpH